jgi:hypothetical protein
MSKETPFINILTYGLPYKLANQIYKEFGSRLSEAKYIINLSDRYKPLAKYIVTVEILLAMTIFHKRVIANLDAAVKFYGTVNEYSNAETIRIGTYDFTGEEKNKVLALIINYNQLCKKYGIPEGINDYEITKEFLIKVLSLLDNSNYGKEQDSKQSKGESEEKDELPF